MKLVIVVPEPVEVTDRSFETAAWWRKVLLTPGEYEMRPPERAPEGVGLWWGGIPGTVVEEDFQSLYFGMPIGKPYDRTQHAGREARYTTAIYGYIMRDTPVHSVIEKRGWDSERQDFAESRLLYRIERRDAVEGT